MSPESVPPVRVLGTALVALAVGLPVLTWGYARRTAPRRTRLYVFEGGLVTGPPEGPLTVHPWPRVRAVWRSRAVTNTGGESGTYTVLDVCDRYTPLATLPGRDAQVLLRAGLLCTGPGAGTICCERTRTESNTGPV